jgi:hypothetical protein
MPYAAKTPNAIDPIDAQTNIAKSKLSAITASIEVTTAKHQPFTLRLHVILLTQCDVNVIVAEFLLR